MSDRSIATRILSLGADGFVRDEDVRFLRETVFADVLVSTDELAAIFLLADRAPDGVPAWHDFFTEIVCDYYLREERPNGYLTETEFEDLRARTYRDATAPSLITVKLLLKILETAKSTPSQMQEFTFARLKAYLLQPKDRGAPQIDKADVALVQRCLYAMGSAENISISRSEAEFLFDLNDAVREQRNDPAWDELFINAVTSHLMNYFGFTPISREEALRRDAWLNDRSQNVGQFFSRMFSAIGRALVEAKPEDEAATESQNKSRAQMILEAEQITPDEANWLAQRIGQDGALCPNERELITNMARLGAELPQDLRALIQNAA